MKIIHLWVALLALGTAACQATVTQPETDTEIAGVVREVRVPPGVPGTTVQLLVEHPGTSAPVDRSIVHVNEETTILVRDPAGQLHPGGFGDLRVGDTAHVWTTGVELRSLPRQVFATRVEVIR